MKLVIPVVCFFVHIKYFFVIRSYKIVFYSSYYLEEDERVFCLTSSFDFLSSFLATGVVVVLEDDERVDLLAHKSTATGVLFFFEASLGTLIGGS